MENKDLKEKFIVLGVSAGIFLPTRILFSAFVTENWLGSLGIISAFAILLVFLIKKEKLGWFGKMFERQMKKTIGGRTGKYIIGFSIFFLLYFGATLFFIDRGDSIYQEDKEIFYLAIMEEQGYSVTGLLTYDLNGPELFLDQASENFQWISNFDYMFSLAYAVMNDMSEGWLSHIVVVMFVEQIEVIGLLVFLRKTYKPITKIHPEKN